MSHVTYLPALPLDEPPAACQRCGSYFGRSSIRREPQTKLRVCPDCFDTPIPAVLVKKGNYWLKDPLPFQYRSNNMPDCTLEDRVDGYVCTLEEQFTDLGGCEKAPTNPDQPDGQLANVVEMLGKNWNRKC